MTRDTIIGGAPRTELDAIELLMQDHREVESLFREFEYLRQKDQDTGQVVALACAELRIHEALKAELFCPAMLDAAGEAHIPDLLAGVEDEGQAIRDLITRVEQNDADPETRDAHFVRLAEHVERQFEDAETRVFPRAKKLEGLDLVSVAARMKGRKAELMS